MSSQAGQFGPNEWLVEEMYQRFLDDPSAVDPAWHDFFADYRPGDADIAPVGNDAPAAPEKAVAEQSITHKDVTHKDVTQKASSGEVTQRPNPQANGIAAVAAPARPAPEKPPAAGSASKAARPAPAV